MYHSKEKTFKVCGVFHNIFGCPMIRIFAAQFIPLWTWTLRPSEAAPLFTRSPIIGEHQEEVSRIPPWSKRPTCSAQLSFFIIVHPFLAGWWLSHPSENMSSSVGIVIPNIWKKKIDVPNHHPFLGSMFNIVHNRSWIRVQLRAGQKPSQNRNPQQNRMIFYENRTAKIFSKINYCLLGFIEIDL